MNKRIVSLLTILMLIGSLLGTSTFAKTGNPHRTLVSLGDSITYGLNLEKPAKDAFPSVMAQRENWELINLGVPGSRTDHLITALGTDQYKNAIASADYITLNIGSNDLLQAYAAAVQFQNPELLETGITTMFTNLTKIILAIKGLNPDAEIAIYNIYNAFQVDDPMHVVANTLLPSINLQISILANQFQLDYVDAFAAFDGKQAQYLLPNDIHPNTKGQKVLAKIGSEAFQQAVKQVK